MAKITLIQKIQESANIVTLVFETKDKVEFKSGFYTHFFILPLIWKFHKPGRRLSFASAPYEDNIMFSINTKSNSLFQQAIQNMKTGDVVHIVKNQGHISLPETKSQIIMIAQGVGITPFRSMILDSVHNKLEHQITLIHVDRDKYLYQKELEKLPIIQHRITREDFESTAQKTISLNNQAIIYLAGTSQFVKSTQKMLIQFGVPKSKIKLDAFESLKE
jgi:glycine betaine catabolism B